MLIRVQTLILKKIYIISYVIHVYINVLLGVNIRTNIFIYTFIHFIIVLHYCGLFNSHTYCLQCSNSRLTEDINLKIGKVAL